MDFDLHQGAVMIACTKRAKLVLSWVQNRATDVGIQCETQEAEQ